MHWHEGALRAEVARGDWWLVAASREYLLSLVRGEEHPGLLGKCCSIGTAMLEKGAYHVCFTKYSVDMEAPIFQQHQAWEVSMTESLLLCRTPAANVWNERKDGHLEKHSALGWHSPWEQAAALEAFQRYTKRVLCEGDPDSAELSIKILGQNCIIQVARLV